MKHLIIDTEQEAMLLASLGGIVEFLRARSVRRDPAGIVSRAAALQQRKVENMHFQLSQPPLAAYQQIPTATRAHFDKLIRAYLDADTDHMRGLFWTQILAFMLAQRAEPERRELPVEKLEGQL